MHQSDDESRQAAIVTCYLDESGTQEGAPIAVVGELLLNKANFASLDAAWWPMLVKHSIEPPLHMKDFRRPGGRLANVSTDCHRELFLDAVEIINKFKIYSLAAVLTDEFSKLFR